MTTGSRFDSIFERSLNGEAQNGEVRRRRKLPESTNSDGVDKRSWRLVTYELRRKTAGYEP